MFLIFAWKPPTNEAVCSWSNMFGGTTPEKKWHATWSVNVWVIIFLIRALGWAIIDKLLSLANKVKHWLKFHKTKKTCCKFYGSQVATAGCRIVHNFTSPQLAISVISFWPSNCHFLYASGGGPMSSEKPLAWAETNEAHCIVKNRDSNKTAV